MASPVHTWWCVHLISHGVGIASVVLSVFWWDDIFLELLCVYVCVLCCVYLHVCGVCALSIVTLLSSPLPYSLIIQVLLTKSDLNDPQSRELLKETVNDLLAMNVIPVLNANDTVSEPYAPDEGDYVRIMQSMHRYLKQRGREGGGEGGREREERGREGGREGGGEEGGSCAH